jgi:hypothetical protein
MFAREEIFYLASDRGGSPRAVTGPIRLSLAPGRANDLTFFVELKQNGPWRCARRRRREHSTQAEGFPIPRDRDPRGRVCSAAAAVNRA